MIDVGIYNDDDEEETTTCSVLNLVNLLNKISLVLYSSNAVLSGGQYMSLGNNICDRE